MDVKEILLQIPHSSPFLFVEELLEVNENGSRGTYIFSENEYFYRGHFKGHPITPGVILTECMAQIGVIPVAIFLMNNITKPWHIRLSHTNIDFFLPVYPGEKVTVTSEKKYFRFNKLNCKVEMRNSQGKLVSRGEISGMVGKI